MFVYDFPHKTQTKACDCWYACLQMLLTWRYGTKTKPGNGADSAVSMHRDGVFGHTLHFRDDKLGERIMEEEGLVAMADKLDLGNGQSILKALKKYGPFMVGGSFGSLGLGHWIVVAGVDSDNDLVYVDDPEWGYGKRWKPLAYLGKMWEGGADDYSAVALAPVG